MAAGRMTIALVIGCGRVSGGNFSLHDTPLQTESTSCLPRIIPLIKIGSSVMSWSPNAKDQLHIGKLRRTGVELSGRVRLDGTRRRDNQGRLAGAFCGRRGRRRGGGV